MAQPEDITSEYPTYNGMNRAAMVWGVPIMPIALCGFVLMMLSMVGASVLGGRAFLLLGLILPVFFGLKSISANDDQAVKIYTEELKWTMRRKNAKLFNGTLTILPTKYGRQQSDYQRFIEQNLQEPTSRQRFSPENLPTRLK